MSDFKKFRALLQDHFNEMVKSGNPLFITDADEDELYNLYLDSFPAGTNELFRKRRSWHSRSESDCAQGCGEDRGMERRSLVYFRYSS